MDKLPELNSRGLSHKGDATIDLLKTIEFEGTPEYYYNKAMLFKSENNFLRAVECLKNAILLNCFEQKYFRTKAYCEAKINNLIACVDDVFECFHTTTEFQRPNLISLSFEEKEELKFLQDYLERNCSRNEVLIALMIVLIKSRKIDRIEGLIPKTSKDIDSELRPVYKAVLAVSLLFKDKDSSIQYLKEAIRLNKSYAYAFTILGSIRKRPSWYGGFDDYKGSIREFSQAIKITPNFPFNYFHRGIAKRGINEIIECIEDLTKSIKLNPYWAVHYHERGNTYLSAQKYSEAIDDYRKAIDLDSNCYFYYEKMGEALEMVGRFLEAIINYEKAIDVSNGFNRYAYFKRGNLKMKIQDFDGAIRDFTNVIEHDSDYHAFVARSDAYAKKGNIEASVNDLLKANSIKKEDIDRFPSNQWYYRD